MFARDEPLPPRREVVYVCAGAGMRQCATCTGRRLTFDRLGDDAPDSLTVPCAYSYPTRYIRTDLLSTRGDGRGERLGYGSHGSHPHGHD